MSKVSNASKVNVTLAALSTTTTLKQHCTPGTSIELSNLIDQISLGMTLRTSGHCLGVCSIPMKRKLNEKVILGCMLRKLNQENQYIVFKAEKHDSMPNWFLE